MIAMSPRIIFFVCLFCLAAPFFGGCSKTELSELGALLVETKLKAKRGDADAQYELGMHYAKNECCSPIPAIATKGGGDGEMESKPNRTML
jgi:hypothetical protein